MSKHDGKTVLKVVNPRGKTEYIVIRHMETDSVEEISKKILDANDQLEELKYKPEESAIEFSLNHTDLGLDKVAKEVSKLKENKYKVVIRKFEDKKIVENGKVKEASKQSKESENKLSRNTTEKVEIKLPVPLKMLFLLSSFALGVLLQLPGVLIVSIFFSFGKRKVYKYKSLFGSILGYIIAIFFLRQATVALIMIPVVIIFFLLDYLTAYLPAKRNGWNYKEFLYFEPTEEEIEKTEDLTSSEKASAILLMIFVPIFGVNAYSQSFKAKGEYKKYVKTKRYIIWSLVIFFFVISSIPKTIENMRERENYELDFEYESTFEYDNTVDTQNDDNEIETEDEIPPLEISEE